MSSPRSLSAAILLLVVCFDCWCGITESEYRARRVNLLRELDSSSACAFKAIDARMRSNDVQYRYRQESNLLYLTGISRPGFALFVCTRGVQVNGQVSPLVLFCQSDLAAELRTAGTFSDGLVVDYGRFAEIFAAVAGYVRTLYVSAPDIHFTDDWLEDKQIFLDADARKSLQDKNPGLKVKNAAPVIARLRQYKSAAEIEEIREAIRITGDGLRYAMGICRPGVMEYELQAAVEYEIVRQGAEYESFPSIVGSGPNSLIPHYIDNRRKILDGDVIVLDVGAECGGYAADISRTIPATGKFSSGQREIYLAVLKAQSEVINMVAPGVPWSALDSRARAVLAREGFANRMGHGVSHHLGLDVHDTVPMDTLRAGMVITVEPGVYIPETDTSFAPAYRGIGVRIEDDVLVGEKGPIVLSKDIPKEIETIERLVGGGTPRQGN